MADWVDVVRLVHVFMVSVWMGAAIFAVFMVAPSVKASAQAGKGFMMTVIRRGGYGKFFGPVAGLAILSGLVLFWARGYHEEPFGTPASAALSVGAIIGLMAFGEGLAVSLPTERKLKALVAGVGPEGPAAEQAVQIQQHADKLAKAGARGLAMIIVAFLLMAGRILLV